MMQIKTRINTYVYFHFASQNIKIQNSTQLSPAQEVLLSMFTLQDSKVKHLVQHNKQYHRKVLLSSFHLNGHTLGFHPQTEKLEQPCTA